MCYQILGSRIKMVLRSGILVITVLLGSVNGQPSGTIDSIYNNPCAKIRQDGQTIYYACGSEPIVLLNNQNAVNNFTVEPASLTCGDPASTFCTLGILVCDECDSSKPEKSHPVQHLTDINAGGSQNLDTWWQSVTWTTYPAPLEINITISFDHLYELQDDLVITFKSGLPTHMVLEKSSDFGQTWSALQYYKSRCNETYPNLPLEVTSDQPDTVICTSAFSTNYPYANGKVIFSVIENRFELFLGDNLLNFVNLYEAFNRTNLNDFLKFSDLRIRLLSPATDGNEKLKREEDLIKYYYGIAGISVIGSCDCNLHGKYCAIGSEGRTVCTCSHNTEGDNCERCEPLYNNKPWRPGFYVPYPTGTANPCEKCECNDHADSCTYSPTLQQGLCDNCQHNTTGATCAECREGFFPNNTLPIPHPDRCTLCDCEPLGVANGNTACVLPDGQCFCQSFTEGRRCDECKDNFFGLLLEDNLPGTCKPCDCNQYGTVNQNSICAKSDGQCPCKLNTDERNCSVCKEGFYSFPTGRLSGDCLDCECDPGGSPNISCHQQTGECQCRSFITLQHCNQTLDGYYAPSLDYQQYQPTGGTCLLDTDLIDPDNPFSGRVFSVCDTAQDVTFDEIDGHQIQPEVIWLYMPTIRYTLKSPESWTRATLRVTIIGESGVDVTAYRARQPDTEILFNCNAEGSLNNIENIQVEGLEPGTGNAWISPRSISVDVRCRYSLQLLVDEKGSVNTSIVIDSVVMMPDHNLSLVYQRALPEEQRQYRDCQRRIAELGTRDQALREYTCRRFSFATTTQLGFGAQLCDCDMLGTLAGGPCDRDGGQCRCKPGVAGRRCDVCAPGFYNRTQTGCLLCPYLPCPGDPLFYSSKSDASSTTTNHLVAIVTVLAVMLLLIILAVVIWKYKRPDMCKPKPKISYIDSERRDENLSNHVRSPLYPADSTRDGVGHGSDLQFDEQPDTPYNIHGSLIFDPLQNQNVSPNLVRTREREKWVDTQTLESGVRDGVSKITQRTAGEKNTPMTFQNPTFEKDLESTHLMKKASDPNDRDIDIAKSTDTEPQKDNIQNGNAKNIYVTQKPEGQDRIKKPRKNSINEKRRVRRLPTIERQNEKAARVTHESNWNTNDSGRKQADPSVLPDKRIAFNEILVNMDLEGAERRGSRPQSRTMDAAHMGISGGKGRRRLSTDTSVNAPADGYPRTKHYHQHVRKTDSTISSSSRRRLPKVNTLNPRSPDKLASAGDTERRTRRTHGERHEPKPLNIRETQRKTTGNKHDPSVRFTEYDDDDLLGGSLV